MLGLTLTPKLCLGATAREDNRRLANDIAERLRRDHFSADVTDGARLSHVVARRGACRLDAWNGDRGAEQRAVFAASSTSGAPIAFGYRGRWSPSPPGVWRGAVRDVVNRLSLVGIVVPRPASIALAASPSCAAAGISLEGLSVWPTDQGLPEDD